MSAKKLIDRPFFYWLAPSCLALLLSACNQPPANVGNTSAAQAQRKHAHAMLYELDPQQSSIVLKVYRDGPLARFGHNHVIVAADLSGKVYREKDWSRSDF